MVVKFEVGKTYRYNGKIGDPSPFISHYIDKQDALFIVSGKPLVCTYVENHSCPSVEFEGMSWEGGWILNGCYHLFDEVEKKTVVKETQKEEKKEMPKFEVGKKYRYTGPSDSVFDFVQIGIYRKDAEYIVSGEPLTVEFSEHGDRIKFKEFKSTWAFLSNMLEKFEEVPAPSSEVDWEKKYAELEKRYHKLKGMFVEYMMDEEVSAKSDGYKTLL